jgi:putative SOS response-associated peptidase YedK
VPEARAYFTPCLSNGHALVTLAPDAEFAKYHDRRPIVLRREDYHTWLDSPASAKTLFEEPKVLPLAVQMAIT